MGSDLLPWSDYEYHTKRRPLDVPFESGEILVHNGNIRERVLCNGEHVLCAIQESIHLAQGLRDRTI